MNPNEDYKVSFGRIARTILYEDEAGALQFGFDVKPKKDPATGKWTLVLESEPIVIGNGRLSAGRATLALSRVRDYTASRGYDVVLFP